MSSPNDPTSFSGVTYTTLYAPRNALSSTERSVCVDPKNAASGKASPLPIPDAPAVLFKCVTWSFISEISGDTTSVVFPVCNAGSW